jgi:hypothetical protein
MVAMVEQISGRLQKRLLATLRMFEVATTDDEARLRGLSTIELARTAFDTRTINLSQRSATNRALNTLRRDGLVTPTAITHELGRETRWRLSRRARKFIFDDEGVPPGAGRTTRPRRSRDQLLRTLE